VAQIPEIQNAVSAFVNPDLKLDIPCRELFYNHRKDINADIYYLINLSDQPVEREFTFRATGNLESWNPMNGGIHPVKGVRKGESNILNIRMEAYESKIFVFSKMR